MSNFSLHCMSITGDEIKTHHLLCDDRALVKRGGDFYRRPFCGVQLGEEGLDIDRLRNFYFAGG